MTMSTWGIARPLAGMVAGAVMLGGTAVASSAQASTSSPGSTVAVAASAERGTVLQSEFGKAKSRVKGTFGKKGAVSGTFTPKRFITRDGKLKVVGTLAATLTRGNGSVVGMATKRVVLPVRLAEGHPVGARSHTSCDILNLVLGPLDLNLLGLEVHLDRVVLNIVATPGPGNLLGNLLCAVAGLLDGTGFLTQIRQILNAILAILRL
jgi:hypothetical protein